MTSFLSHSEAHAPPHRFHAYDCVATGPDELAHEIGTLIRELYVEPSIWERRLRETALGMGRTISEHELAQKLQRIARASIPAPGTHPVPHLDVARNELAEILAYEAMRDVHGAVMPAMRVREKEVRGQPSRGIDAVGIREDPIQLFVGEVKASAQALSPPAVVHSGDDSLRSALLSHLGDSERIVAEIAWMGTHTPAQHDELVARAMFLQSGDELPLIVAPFLIRTAESHGVDDYNPFRDSPDDFDPSQIDFVIIRLDGRIEDLARDAYDFARGGP